MACRSRKKTDIAEFEWRNIYLQFIVYPITIFYLPFKHIFFRCYFLPFVSCLCIFLRKCGLWCPRLESKERLTGAHFFIVVFVLLFLRGRFEFVGLFVISSSPEVPSIFVCVFLILFEGLCFSFRFLFMIFFVSFFSIVFLFFYVFFLFIFYFSAGLSFLSHSRSFCSFIVFVIISFFFWSSFFLSFTLATSLDLHSRSKRSE